MSEMIKPPILSLKLSESSPTAATAPHCHRAKGRAGGATDGLVIRIANLTQCTETFSFYTIMERASEMSLYFVCCLFYGLNVSGWQSAAASERGSGLQETRESEGIEKLSLKLHDVVSRRRRARVDYRCQMHVTFSTITYYGKVLSFLIKFKTVFTDDSYLPFSEALYITNYQFLSFESVSVNIISFIQFIHSRYV